MTLPEKAEISLFILNISASAAIVSIADQKGVIDFNHLTHRFLTKKMQSKAQPAYVCLSMKGPLTAKIEALTITSGTRCERLLTIVDIRYQVDSEIVRT